MEVRHHPPRRSQQRLRGRLCWEALEQRDEPCPGCPLFFPRNHAPKTIGVLEDTPAGIFKIVRTLKEGNAARVDVCCVTDVFLSELVSAKIGRLTTQAGLSLQERKVFDLISAGLRTKDIAAALKISPRTAKFHGGNLLRKLGADSRAAILRLLLRPAGQGGPRTGAHRIPRA